MISVAEAKERIQNHIALQQIHWLPIAEAEGSILAEDISAPIDVPSFTNSSMDGYALFFEPERKHWQVIGTIKAGEIANVPIQKGEAMRIFTGAMLPEGANVVVQQEWIEREGDTIVLRKGEAENMLPLHNIRQKGAQCQAGTCILRAHTQLEVGSIGLLATVGIASVPVYAPPTVALLMTGDELVPLGGHLQTGQIYEANSALLKAYLRKIGIKTIESALVKDQPEILTKSIENSLEKYDVLILAGGVSVGDYDFVPQCLAQNKVENLLYKVKQKPGKPLWVGKKGTKWVFALPGNPASVATCFNQYLKPALLQMMGHGLQVWQPNLTLPLKTPFSKKAGLTHLLKVKIIAGEVIALVGQESFNLAAYNEATHIAYLEEAKEYFAEGTLVPLFEW
ncbi:MAG: molybdopterin molybdenumtransferase MoeA [Cytophagales bacterium]|nr:MAG: molybdopterin molybdenumtransferase MoeA [Cytophagales bacterium]